MNSTAHETLKFLREKYEWPCERFNREAKAAFEEPVENYQGGFVPMRYIEPPDCPCPKCRINYID